MTLTHDLLLELVRAGATVEVGADGSFVVIGAMTEKRTKGNAARCSRYRQRKQEACQTMSEHVESCQNHVGDTLPLPLSPSPPLSPQTPLSPAHPHTPAPACTREREAHEAALPGLEPEPKQSKGRGTQAELEAYAVELGLPPSDGTAMFDHWTANGWRNGQVASKCWRAGMRNWQRNGWMPSQKGNQRTNGYHQPDRHAAYTPAGAMAKLKPGQSPQDF